jgi:hypothetical protein
LAFFCSAIFKDKALLKGLAILVGVHVFLAILEVFMGITIPSPLNYLGKMLQNNSFNFESGLNHNLHSFILDRWQQLVLNSKALIQVAFSGVMFVAGTLIYKYREVK